MASLAYTFTIFSIATTAVLTVLACISTSVQALKAQNMTANNTRKNNDSMNDSGITASNQVPIRPPFVVESNNGYTNEV